MLSKVGMENVVRKHCTFNANTARVEEHKHKISIPHITHYRRWHQGIVRIPNETEWREVSRNRQTDVQTE
jgi:hypothetical protein